MCKVKESVIIEMGVREIRFWKVSMAGNTVEMVKLRGKRVED